MKKFIINENTYQKIFEQDVDSEYVEVTPEEYIEYLDYVNGNGNALSNLKKFKNKKIIVTAPLDLRKTNAVTLGPIDTIRGRLDISYTKVSELPVGLKASYIWDTGSPVEAKRKAAELRKRRNDAQQRREDDEWNLESGDEMAEMVHALLEYLNNDGELEVRTKEDETELQELNAKLEVLQAKKDQSDGGEGYDEILYEIEEVEEKINEIEEKKDVYDLYYDGDHYDMSTFKLIDSDEKTWAVGTESQVKSSAYSYVEGLIDDIGYKGFSRWTWEDNLDRDMMYDEAYSAYLDWIQDDPENYNIDKVLSREQERKIEKLEEEIDRLEQQQEVLDDELEDYQELYDDYEEKIQELRDEISEIEDDPDDYDEDEMERVATSMAKDLSSDADEFFNLFGIENVDNYIDRDAFIDEVISSDGYGIINGYDGQYDTIYVNGTEYYIMRID